MHADDGDAPASEFDESCGGVAEAGGVLGQDAVVGVEPQVLANDDERVVDVDVGGVAGVQVQRTEDQTVGQGTERAVEHVELGLAVHAGGVEDDVLAPDPRLLHDIRGEFGEVGHPRVGNGQADDVAVPLTQVLGRHVERVAEFVDGGEDLGPRGVADERVVVDHIRHGFDRDAGAACHVVHGDVSLLYHGRLLVVTMMRGQYRYSIRCAAVIMR